MSPVTEVVAAQSPDARRPPPAAAWVDRATSEVLEMSSPDALASSGEGLRIRVCGYVRNKRYVDLKRAGHGAGARARGAVQSFERSC